MVFPALWCLPPKTLALGEEEVHVWRAALNRNSSCIQNLQQTLAPDEQRRAERFHFRKDREHFIVARGLLRIILSRYLDVEPKQLRFCYSPYGKPALAKESGGDVLRFNLSHSHEIALYALTLQRDLGVDLEQIRTDWASEQIAAQFFAPSEVAQLRALPANLWHEAFFHCWTRKEAYIKARGEGLSLPLDKFEVSLAPGESAALLSTKSDPEEASRWSMKELRVGPDYAAALVVRGHDWQPQYWQL